MKEKAPEFVCPTPNFQDELARYLSAVSCGILQYTRDSYHLVYANQIALDILGYSSAEAMQTDFASGVAGTVHPEDIKQINRLVSTLKNEEDKVEYQYRVTVKSGKNRLCYGAARLIFRGENEEPLIQRTIVDITDAQSRLHQETEAMIQAFQIASGTTGDIVFLYDFKEKSSFLVTAPEATPMEDRLLLDVPYGPSKHKAIAPNSVKDFIRLHEAMLSGEDSAKGHIELVNLFGHTGLYEVTFHALKDNAGDPIGKAVGIYRDVTRFEKKEREQRGTIETLSRTFDSVYRIDFHAWTYQRITENEESALVFPSAGSWLTMFEEYKQKFVAAPYLPSLSAWNDPEALIRRLLDEERIAVEYRRNDGGWRRAFMLISERDEEHSPVSAVFAVQRIDLEKQKELDTQKALQEAYAAAQLASEAKTTFLSNMSHDIRTPLNAIIGMTSIAETHLDDPEKVADCLKKIVSSGKHLLGLINQILDMSKIESGKVDLSEGEFNLAEMLEEAVSLQQVAAKAKGHELSVETEELKHPDVIGDKIRLEQVLNNLLSNAIKYTPDHGKIHVVFREKETNKDNVGWYEIEVADNGIGMSPEYVKTIFDPFSRSSDPRAASAQGTGLGMPITRNILRMMNGDIRVESKPDEGSVFTASFALRIQASLSDSPESPDNVAEPALPDFSGRRILLVEDNELNREIATELLGATGVSIDSATNGQEGVEKFLDNAPGYYDLIFMDIQMPVLDGHGAARAIRASSHPDAKFIPIVAMSANAFSTDVRAAIDAGMNAHIAKPIDMATVIKTMKQYME